MVVMVNYCWYLMCVGLFSDMRISLFQANDRIIIMPGKKVICGSMQWPVTARRCIMISFTLSPPSRLTYNQWSK